MNPLRRLFSVVALAAVAAACSDSTPTQTEAKAIVWLDNRDCPPESGDSERCKTQRSMVESLLDDSPIVAHYRFVDRAENFAYFIETFGSDIEDPSELVSEENMQESFEVELTRPDEESLDQFKSSIEVVAGVDQVLITATDVDDKTTRPLPTTGSIWFENDYCPIQESYTTECEQKRAQVETILDDSPIVVDYRFVDRAEMLVKAEESFANQPDALEILLEENMPESIIVNLEVSDQATLDEFKNSVKDIPNVNGVSFEER